MRQYSKRRMCCDTLTYGEKHEKTVFTRVMIKNKVNFKENVSNYYERLDDWMDHCDQTM